MKHIQPLSIIIGLLMLMSIRPLHAQQISKAKKGTFALTNANIETVTNGTVQGTLLIQDGKISALAANVEIPAGAEVIDCSGQRIYPGFIDGGTRLGLSEVGSLSLTQDFYEIGDISPHMQALTAVNPNATAIPVTRVSGVTTVLSAPAGGLFAGTAALIDLHGYTPAQMYAGFKAVVLNFPSSGRRGRWDNRSEEDIKKLSENALKKLNKVWEEASAYHQIDAAYKAGKGEAPGYYPEMAALAPITQGNAKILIEVHRASDIEIAIKWVQEKEIDAVFTGVSEGWRVADQLAAAHIPVITGPVLSTPSRASDRYDRPYRNAGLMQKAGVKVALRTNESDNVRNLPFHAGFAAAYGMGKEEALRAVTIVPAEIFGVADHLGSLEVGKQANLIVTNGDPFETATDIIHVFIGGWQIPMDSRHIRLYHEFLKREPGLRE